MTIAIGLIRNVPAERSTKAPRPLIVLASDSQTTCGSAKSFDTQKISIIDFLDAQILVAQAGVADLSDKAVEIMKAKAKAIPLDSSETVTKIAQQSMRELRESLVELNRGCNFSDDGWKRFFLEQNYFQLMVGYFFNREPHLFTIDIDWCLAVPTKTPFKAIGAGKDLGEFLLREYSQIDPSFVRAQIIAVSVVEKVIDNIDGCGHPTWVGCLYPVSDEIIKSNQRLLAESKPPPFPLPHRLLYSEAFLTSQQTVEMFAEELKKWEKQSAAERNSQIKSILQKVWKRKAEQDKKEFKAFPGGPN